MATTRLSDVVVPEVYENYFLKKTAEKARIFKSGAVRTDPEIAKKLSGGGRTFNVPFWRDLDDTTEASLATDNPADVLVPDKIGTDKDISIRQYRTKGWQNARLTAEMAGDDPAKAIMMRTGDWWDRHHERLMISTVKGVIADNEANDGGDMVFDISTQGAISDANRISAEAILDTSQTMGDASDDLSLIILHSVVYNKLAKLNLIDFIPDSEGKVSFPTYLGYNILKTDFAPIVAGTNNVYWTMLIGNGAFGYGESKPEEPMAEVHREPLQGMGAGVETLVTRRQFALHPYGVKFADASVAGSFPTNAELENAANWDRVYPERKQIKIALLKTNA